MLEKYLIVGDVHGCIEEFMHLLDTINWWRYPRQIISVGDLLDKNPGYDNYQRILTFCRDYKVWLVPGNHEEKHLRFEERDLKERQTGRKNQMAPAKDPSKHEDFWATRLQLLSLCSKGWDPFRWMSQFSYYYYIPDTDMCVVHGGLEKDRKPEDTLEKVICRVRNLDPKTGKMVHLAKITEETPFWTEVYEGDTFILYGHAPTLKPRETKNTLGLDTGCVYGNTLTGYLYPEKVIVSVNAKQAYCTQEYGWLNENI